LIHVRHEVPDLELDLVRRPRQWLPVEQKCDFAVEARDDLAATSTALPAHLWRALHSILLIQQQPAERRVEWARAESRIPFFERGVDQYFAYPAVAASWAASAKSCRNSQREFLGHS
jgi:hypothetical protein